MRYTIRDLLWVLFVVALSVAWYLDRNAQKAKHEDEMQKEQGKVAALTNEIRSIEKRFEWYRRYNAPE